MRMKHVADQGAALRSLTKSLIRITFAHRKGEGREAVIHYLISLTFVSPPPLLYLRTRKKSEQGLFGEGLKSNL